MFRKNEKIFISHASKNKGFVSKRILPQARRAKRDYWYDQNDIKGGDNFRQELLTGVLDDCQRLLVVASKEAVRSEWVKEELAFATKDLMVKNSRVDARSVHRRILPVKIDERDAFGNTIEAGQDVDLFTLHPYLTLVSFISVPYNAELAKKLDHHSEKYPQLTLDDYLEGQLGYSAEQTESVKEYIIARDEALAKVEAALRDPDKLKYGFKRMGRLAYWLAQPTFQRVALAACLLVALFSLIQVPPLIGPLSIDVATQNPAEINPVKKITVSEFPAHLQIRAKNLNGLEKITNYELVHTGSQQPGMEAPEIKIEIRPYESNEPSTGSSARVTDRPPGMTNVSFQSNNSPPQEPDSAFEIVSDENEARKAKDAGKLVWSIRATVPNSKKSVTHYLVANEFVPPTGHPTDPGDPNSPTAPTIAILKGGQPLDLNEISVTADPLELSIVAKNKNGTKTTKKVTLRSESHGAEIEFAIRTGKKVTNPKLAKDLRSAKVVSISNEPSSIAVRTKTNNGVGKWTFLKLASTSPPGPGLEEIEMYADGKLVKLEPGKTAVLPVTKGPMDLLIVGKKKDGTEVPKGGVRLLPASGPSPGAVAIKVNGRLLQQGKTPQFPMTNEPLKLRIETEAKDGTPFTRFVSVQPPPPVELEFELNAGELTKRGLLNEDLDKAGTISMSDSLSVVGVRTKTRNGEGSWKYLRLKPPQLPDKSPEITIYKDKKLWSLDAISAGDNPSELTIVAKNQNGKRTEKKIQLKPESGSGLIAMSVNGKRLQKGETPEFTAANGPLTLKIDAENKNGTVFTRNISVRPRTPRTPKTDIEMKVNGKLVNGELRLPQSMKLDIEAKTKNGTLVTKSIVLTPQTITTFPKIELTLDGKPLNEGRTRLLDMPNDSRTLKIAAKIGSQPRVTSYVKLRPPKLPKPEIEVLINRRRVKLSRDTDSPAIPISGQALLAVRLAGNSDWGYARVACDSGTVPPPIDVNPKTGSLMVRVLGQREVGLVPIPNAMVHFKKQTGGTWIKRQANEDGVYYANGLQAGQWLASARVRPDSRGTPDKVVTVRAGGQANVEIVIEGEQRRPEQPRSEPARLVVKVVKQETEMRTETRQRGERQVDIAINVPVQRPILNANVYLRRDANDNQGVQLQRSPKGDGFYYVDIAEGTATGRWEYAVGAPGSSKVYQGEIMVTAGQPAVITIGGAPERPVNPGPGLKVAGQWRCSCGGIVNLEQNGAQVSGTENNQNGQNRITGTIEGNSFSISYRGSDGRDGSGVLTPDGSGNLSGQVRWSDGKSTNTTLTPMRVSY